MEYTVIRSARKTLSLEIDRQGAVLIRAPLRLDDGVIRQFVDAHTAWIERNRQKRLALAERYPPLSDAEIDVLRQKAMRILPPKVEQYAVLMGVRPVGVTITAAKTRFGSCSTKNRLCFSLYLMRYPEDAVDYVVVHELAHIRHHNHSPAFYALVARFMPDYRRREALLRT